MNIDLKIPWRSKDYQTRLSTGAEFYGLRDYINQRNQGAVAWDNINAINAIITNATIGTLTITGTFPYLPLVGGTLTGNLVFNPTTLGVKGTTTNDAAAAGNVGEVISTGTVSATNLTNNVLTDIGFVDLTAGNWILYGQFFFHNTTSVNTQAIGAVTTTSGNSFTGATQGVTRMDIFPSPSTSVDVGVNITQPVSIASTTRHYLKAFVTYSAGQGQAGGILFGIRTR